MEQFQNIKTSINNAKNIKIIFPENPDDDVLGSVLALYAAFRQLNKKVSLLNERLPQKAKRFLSFEKKKIMITLNEEVSEIYYEKKGNHVDLNIVPKNKDFNSENFSWEIVPEKTNNKDDGEPSVEPLDLIIIIGISRFEEVEKYLPTDEEELFACTIVNIDKNITNENYGDVNIVEKDFLTKTIALLIKELTEYSFAIEVFDFLLFGFFSQKRLSPRDISTIKWITNNNGTLDSYFKYQNEQKPLWATYLEEALKNISTSENNDVVFSYLPIEKEINDKEKIKNILQVSKLFREWINPSTFFLCFEEDYQTKTIFYSSSTSIINKISSQYRGKFKETGGIIMNKEDDPMEAVNELKKAL
jgi:hypothetical protein